MCRELTKSLDFNLNLVKFDLRQIILLHVVFIVSAIHLIFEINQSILEQQN